MTRTITQERRITRDDALGALRQVVKKFGPDMTYEKMCTSVEPDRLPDGGCRYATPSGEPLCIVGQVLAVLGVPFLRDGSGNFANGRAARYLLLLEATFDPGAIRALGEAQHMQDGGEPWGVALKAAEEAMTITEQDIKNLTPAHRIVWHQPPGQPVEMGLHASEGGLLRTDGGITVRYPEGGPSVSAQEHIVRIIPPAFTPREGRVIGKRSDASRRLVHTGDGDGVQWLGHAPEIDMREHWFDDDNVRDLLQNHGWEVMGDLSAPAEVTDAEVVAAATAVLRASTVAVRNPELMARRALEAAREARNG